MYFFILVDLLKTAVLQDRQVKGEPLGLLEVLNQLFRVLLIALSGSVPMGQNSASPTLCVRERAGQVQQRTLLRSKGRLSFGVGTNLRNLPCVYVCGNSVSGRGEEVGRWESLCINTKLAKIKSKPAPWIVQRLTLASTELSRG